MAANDRQVDGDHYKRLGKFQPWDVLAAWLTPEEYRGWQKGVAIVYLARERQKAGNTDIEKAGHHIEKLVEWLKDAPPIAPPPSTPPAPGEPSLDTRLLYTYRTLANRIAGYLEGRVMKNQVEACLQACDELEKSINQGE